MGSHRIVVIGAGVGGLVTALSLAARGCEVVICERAAAPGGKMRTLDAGGRAVDAGPTVFTMRWVFDEILAGVGCRLDDIVKLVPATTLARHAWPGDDRHGPQRLDLFTDLARSEAAIADFAGGEAAHGFRSFCRASRQTYEALQRTFLVASKPSMPGLVARLGVSGLTKFSQSSPFATLWSELGQHFKDPRLRQLFARYATYVGSSPFACPATLMLIAHVEQEGVWLVDGGMSALADGLARTAARLGAEVRYGTHVAEVVRAGGRAAGVRLASGETIAADAVVFNGDAAALEHGLLGPAAQSPRAGNWGRGASGERSLSALTWVMQAEAAGFPLVHHNVFFGPDYAREFDDLFARQRVPAHPTVYVCAQDRADHDRPVAAAAEAAHTRREPPERLFILVCAPATGDAEPGSSPARHTASNALPTSTSWTNPEEIASCRTHMMERLAACGLTVMPVPRTETVTTPRDFEALFPGTGGALYGRASHGWMASFQRPGSRTRLKGLYLAGGSVHPGAGVPMAALSGRLAAQSVLADLTSIRPSHRVAMPGGISTDSATTASTPSR